MPQIGAQKVEAARRLARALTRGLVAEGEAPEALRAKPIAEVVADVEAWFATHEAALVESTVDLGFLYADRLLGVNVELSELSATLQAASDEDLVRYQEQRVTDLAGRMESSKAARTALWNTLGEVFASAVGFALWAVLPKGPRWQP